jgi:hypothetical protein
MAMSWPTAGEPGPHAGGDGLVGAQGLAAAAQDGGVAGLQAQRRGVRRDVGPGLVNDADDAQGYAHLADLDARGATLDVADLAHRVGQRGDLLQALGHGFDPLGGERQAVDQGCIQAFGSGGLQVLAVGFQQLRLAIAYGAGHGEQRVVLGLGGGGGHEPAGLPGLAAEGLHVIEGVHDSYCKEQKEIRTPKDGWG